jgi:hypothetical protein
MTMRAPERRDQVAVLSAQPVLGRRLLRQSARFAITDFVRLPLSLHEGWDNGRLQVWEEANFLASKT